MSKLNRSIDRGLAVLEAVSDAGTCSLAALAVRTGLPKPTLLRICATLEARRWLFRRRSDGNYQLGSAFPRGDRSSDEIDRLVAVGKDEILELSRETGLGVDLAAGIGGGRVEIVDTSRRFQVHGVHPDSVGYRPSPVLSALGTAYLSAMSPEERIKTLHNLLERLPREDVEALPRLAANLKEIAERGYAVRPKGHWGRAVDFGALPAAIAVPIVAENVPVGALNLVWNANDRSVEEVAETHLRRLQQAACTIGEAYPSEADS